MSVRLRNPNAPADATAGIGLLQLENIAIRANARGREFEIDHQASEGDNRFFVLLGAGRGRKLDLATDNIDDVVKHLELEVQLNDAPADLPCTPGGDVDPSTQQFKCRRAALSLKTGYGILDCDKALRWADGDAYKAMSKLIETSGYAATKV